MDVQGLLRALLSEVVRGSVLSCTHDGLLERCMGGRKIQVVMLLDKE